MRDLVEITPDLALAPNTRQLVLLFDQYQDWAGHMGVQKGKVIAGGRIALPADIRRALGLENGDTVLFEVEGDGVRIRPAKSALRRIQDRLQGFAPQDGLVSDELIADRRAEARRE